MIPYSNAHPAYFRITRNTGWVFHFPAVFTKLQLPMSNSPRSVSFSSGITGKHMKARHEIRRAFLYVIHRNYAVYHSVLNGHLAAEDTARGDINNMASLFHIPTLILGSFIYSKSCTTNLYIGSYSSNLSTSLQSGMSSMRKCSSTSLPFSNRFLMAVKFSSDNQTQSVSTIK